MKAGKNQQVIMRFIDAVSNDDRDRILSFFSDQSVVAAVEQQPAVGASAIWQALAQVRDDAEAVEWQVDSLSETAEGDVATEGLLRYRVDGQWQEFSVCGTFEVRGSKIAQWRETPAAEVLA